MRLIWAEESVLYLLKSMWQRVAGPPISDRPVSCAYLGRELCHAPLLRIALGPRGGPSTILEMEFDKLSKSPHLFADLLQRCVRTNTVPAARRPKSTPPCTKSPATTTPSRPYTKEKASAVEAQLHRSEERRVGKECRSRWPPYH